MQVLEYLFHFGPTFNPTINLFSMSAAMTSSPWAAI